MHFGQVLPHWWAVGMSGDLSVPGSHLGIIDTGHLYGDIWYVLSAYGNMPVALMGSWDSANGRPPLNAPRGK